MRKIHYYFELFIVTFLVLCLLTGVVIFYTTQSDRIQSLALESQTLLSEWNQFENQTYQILLGRYTASEFEHPPMMDKWASQYSDFSRSLENLMNKEKHKRNPSMQSRMEGVCRVWRYTEVQLNNARFFFDLIIQTGLDEKVMVNGFLHTMYKLRMQKQLTPEEIFLLDDTLDALDTLDESTKEFDTLITSIVEELRVEGQIYLRRIRIFSFGLITTALLILILSFLVNRQLKAAQNSRKIYLENSRNQILLALCRNSTEENSSLFNAKSQELGLSLSLDRPILPLMIQVDDFPDFSHELSLIEQQTTLKEVIRFYTDFFQQQGFSYDHFQYGNDALIFLTNPLPPEEGACLDELTWYEGIRQNIEELHREFTKKGLLSLTTSLGNLNTEILDLDRDFNSLLHVAEYRYILGKGQFIFMGSSSLPSAEQFLYPQEKERHFEEALNSLSEEEALRFLDEMIDYGKQHSPQDLRRLVLRLTATLSSLVEQLQRTYHLQTISSTTPMITRVQSPDTIDEVREILSAVILQTISSCRSKKEEKHDQTVVEIKTIIQTQLRDFNLSAETIADHFALTTAYLNRLFKTHTGFSIAGYINLIRLEIAEERLRESDISVAEICDLSGFSNQASFFRLFKKRYGRTPGDYQKEMLRRENSPAPSAPPSIDRPF